MGLVNLIVRFNGIRWPGFDINLVKVKFQLSICRSFGARVSGSWRRIFLSSTRLSTSSEAKRFTIVNHCQPLPTIVNHCQLLSTTASHCQPLSTSSVAKRWNQDGDNAEICKIDKHLGCWGFLLQICYLRKQTMAQSANTDLWSPLLQFSSAIKHENMLDRWSLAIYTDEQEKLLLRENNTRWVINCIIIIIGRLDQLCKNPKNSNIRSKSLRKKSGGANHHHKLSSSINSFTKLKSV